MRLLKWNDFGLSEADVDPCFTSKDGSVEGSKVGSVDGSVDMRTRWQMTCTMYVGVEMLLCVDVDVINDGL